MKKIIIRLVVGFVLLLIVGVVVLAFTFDTVVRRAVMTVGPRVTGVDLQLDAVELSLFSGEGSLKGFVLGNPAGYASPSCIQFDQADLALEPASLLSDKVVVRHLRVVSPVITFEGSLKGNNFSDLRKGLRSADQEKKNGTTQGTEKPDDEAGSRRLQVDELTLTGARLNVIIKELGGQPQAFLLPDLQLTDLGREPEGVTSGELARLVLEGIFKAALEEWAKSGGDSDPLAEAALKDLNDSNDSDLKRAARGVLELIRTMNKE